MLPILKALTGDLLFIDDKDAVVLGGQAWDRMLAGHLPLIVTIENGEREKKRWILDITYTAIFKNDKLICCLKHIFKEY